MCELTGSQLTALERRLAICQACVYAASEHLDEYGDPDTSAGLVYSYQELETLLKEIRLRSGGTPPETDP